MTEDDKLTANGKLDVVDPDKGEAVFKPQTDIAGTHGKFSIDANGNWKYELNNSDPKVQALGAGEKLTETFEVVTADGTKGTVTITVNGTNDKPTITGAAGDVKEDSVEEVSGQLDKHDVDANDKHTWSVNDAGKGQYGTFTVDQNGKWTYVLDNKSTQVQALAEGQKVTDTITVTVDDGRRHRHASHHRHRHRHQRCPDHLRHRDRPDQGRQQPGRDRPADPARRRHQRHAYLVRQRRRQGQVRFVHR